MFDHSLQKKILGNVALSVMFLALAPYSTFTQVRCDLESALQGSTKQCLDVAALNGQTIQVPSNTTRIDNDGLSICAPSVTGAVQPVDVVFAVDISGSMRSNDPDFFAPEAVETSIQQLYDLSPASTAGYIGFANGNCDGTGPKGVKKILVSPLLQLNQGGNFAALKALATSYTPDDYDCGSRNQGGTNYYAVLNQSKTYLSPPHVKTPRQAIIFVSDGEPTGNNAQLTEYNQTYGANVANPDLPPVFSIFIGKGNGAPLRSLSERSGGTFYAVASGDNAKLQQAMRDIVNQVVAVQAVNYTQLTNSTNGQSAQALADGHVLDGAGKYSVQLNDVVGLREGANSITVQIASRNAASGKLENAKTAKFVLNVAAAPSTQKGQKNVDATFGVRCYDPSKLTATNPANQPIQTLDNTHSKFAVELQTAPSLVGDAASGITATRSKDSETLAMTRKGANALTATYSGEIAFSVITGGGKGMNKVVEAQVGDDVTITWTHPRDDRDKASVKLSILDKSAPETVSATLIPYYPVKGQTPKNDTLAVVFNKPAVLVNGAPRPFQLRNSDGTLYEFVLKPLPSSGDTLLFEIVSVEGVLLPKDRDSLWIKLGQIADVAGNVQSDPNNKRVLLAIKPLPSVKIISALSPVASYPEAPKYPDHWAIVRTVPGITEQTISRSSRNVVLVEPAPPSGKPDSALGVRLEASRSFKAEIFVYSNLGEYINQLELDFPPEQFLQLQEGSEGGKRRIDIKWDGFTDKGVKVGTGAYVFRTVLTLRPQGGQKSEIESKIIRMGFLRP